MMSLGGRTDILADLLNLRDEAQRAIDALERCNPIDLQESVALVVALSDAAALKVVEAIEGTL